MNMCSDTDKETSSVYNINIKKILQARLKIKKNHVMVMFLCINLVNTYAIQHMNPRLQEQLYTPVRSKSFWKCENITMKTINIILWFLKIRKGMHHIHKITLYFDNVANITLNSDNL